MSIERNKKGMGPKKRPRSGELPPGAFGSSRLQGPCRPWAGKAKVGAVSSWPSGLGPVFSVSGALIAVDQCFHFPTLRLVQLIVVDNLKAVQVSYRIGVRLRRRPTEHGPSVPQSAQPIRRWRGGVHHIKPLGQGRTPPLRGRLFHLVEGECQPGVDCSPGVHAVGMSNRRGSGTIKPTSVMLRHVLYKKRTLVHDQLRNILHSPAQKGLR